MRVKLHSKSKFIFSLLFFIAIHTVSVSQNKNNLKSDIKGRYKIEISLTPKINGKEIKGGEKIYLIKEKWGQSNNNKSIIDSAIINNKREALFDGEVYSLYEAIQKGRFENIEDKFTAGCYKIKLGSYYLFNFMFSNIDGGNFKEKFIAIQSPSNYIQYYKRITPKKDKYGAENELYISYQNIKNLLSASYYVRDKNAIQEIEKEIKRIGLDSIGRIDKTLTFRAEKEIPNSLFYILQKVENQKNNYHLLTDDRIIFTKFGEDLFERYLKEIELLPTETAINELHKLLDNKLLTLQKLKSEMVQKSFTKFSNSQVMGRDIIAVDIAQNYILNKKVAVSEKTFHEANFFTTLNKENLIGMTAPQIELKQLNGERINHNDYYGEYTILYFYTDDCSYCKTETPKLINFLDHYTYTPINLITIYMGDSAEKCENYIKENFNTINPFVNRIDVIDLEKDSDIYTNYGIITTPTIYLLNPNSTILGKKIKTDELKEILENEEISRKKLHNYFKRAFTNTTVKEQQIIIDTLAKSSIGDFYYEIISELYKFLISQNDYNNQLGAVYLGEKYICPNSQEWKNKKFAKRVCEAVKMFNLNKLGEKANNINLHTIAGQTKDLISKENKYQILFFFTPDCGICNEATTKLKKLYSKYKKNVVFTSIYTKNNIAEFKKYVIKNKIVWDVLYEKDEENRLHQVYDIQNVPAIYLLNKDKIVVAKDITIEDLEIVLKEHIKK